MSETRVRTLLDAVERLAQDADPDVIARIARVESEIRGRQRELERPERGGALPAVEDDRLMEETENLLHLAQELPADFARVA